MLAGEHASQGLEEPRQNVKCRVELPQDWDDRPSGAFPTRANDRRRFPRFHYRVRAVFQSRQTFPALSCSGELCIVYTTQISRGGMAFMHYEQLFPRQRFFIYFSGGMRKELEVVWCRRCNDKCYEVGARFNVELDHKIVSSLLND